ncbi:MAG: sugar porter family MFS transporter [Verrucomicrobia bacterium]|nr:sugar porter family MFS transporter [Verrucomicrobiota bacterium]
MKNTLQSQGNLWYVIGICLVAALGGFLFGFDMVVVSGTIKPLTQLFHLTPFQVGWATSCCVFACIPGAACAGKLADVLGRKKVLLGTAVLFAVSAVGAGWAGSFTAFSFYRILGGLAIGAASGVAPIYIAEVAPTRLRGRFVSFYQLAIVVGVSAAFYSNYFLLATGADAWRWMLTAGVVPALLFLGFMFVVPETPRWLAKMGRDEDALAVLSRVDGTEYARGEMAVIRETLQVRRGSLADLLEPRMLRIVIIGSLLGIFSQISGVNAVTVYAPDIFEKAGAGTRDSLFQSSLIGLTFIVFTFVPILFVERFGRRPILIVGVSVMAVALMGLTGLMSDVSGKHNMLLITLILVYIAAYASSIACLTWVILSEIFPNRIRGEAMSVANLCLWAANSVLLLTFPIIQAKFGLAAPFAVYATICVIIVLFVWKFIPETKGKSLEEIEIQLVGLRSRKYNPF